LDKTVININIVDKYFDIKEFDASPLKPFLKYEFRPLMSMFKIGTIYGMKKNTIKVQNSPFGFGDSKTYEYFSISKKE